MVLASIVSQHCQVKLMEGLDICKDVPGEVWELGVFNGGTAELIENKVGKSRQIRLFDSFEGLPEVHEKDNYCKPGMFKCTAEEQINAYFGPMEHVSIHKGWLPDTLEGLEDSTIAFAHIDIDLYEGHLSCLEFIYPRMPKGGVLVFDDYGLGSCQGVTLAVNEFFADKPEVIERHDKGHGAMVIKL